jgi:hypothetical protein
MAVRRCGHPVTSGATTGLFERCYDKVRLALRQQRTGSARSPRGGGGHVGVRVWERHRRPPTRSSWWRNHLASDTLTHGRVGPDTATRDAQVPRDATCGAGDPGPGLAGRGRFIRERHSLPGTCVLLRFRCFAGHPYG